MLLELEEWEVEEGGKNKEAEREVSRLLGRRERSRLWL